MLPHINWAQYMIGCVFILAVYYAIIIVLFFKKLSPAIPAKDTPKQTSLFNSVEEPPLEQPAAVDVQPLPALPPEVSGFVDEFNALLEQSAAVEEEKGVIKDSIQRLLQKYPSLKDNGFKASINHLIAVETERICLLHLSAEELASVWG